MAVISFNIPDNKVQIVLNAFATVHSYEETIPTAHDDPTPIPNPESKAAFAKRMLLDHIRGIVKGATAVEAEAAAQAIKDAADTDTENITVT